MDVLEKEDRVVDGVTMKKDSPTFETYRRLTVEISKLRGDTGAGRIPAGIQSTYRKTVHSGCSRIISHTDVCILWLEPSLLDGREAEGWM